MKNRTKKKLQNGNKQLVKNEKNDGKKSKHPRVRASRQKPPKKGMLSRWITFLKEVKVEMKKVTWPPRKEIVSSTTALIVSTLMIAFYLGLVDLILAEGIQPALSGKPNAMSIGTIILFGGILVWVFKTD